MGKQGVITRIDGKTCNIHSQGETLCAYIPKKIRGAGRAKGKSKPVCVGDEVEFTEETTDKVVLQKVFPRRTKLSRRAVGERREQLVVSNIDQMLIVTSIYSPPFHPGIIDRFIVASSKGGLTPIICINKIDLMEQTDQKERILYIVETYRKLGYPVVLTSNETGEGLEELKDLLKNKSTVVGGHSGVGKSSLLSSLDPNLKLVTKEVSSKSLRGQHATTSVTLLPFKEGGYVVDTPGIRELSLWQTEINEVALYFPELEEFRHTCKYRDCTHTHEPRCGVKEAVEQQQIENFRYQSYCHILHSVINPEDDMMRPGENFDF